MANMGWNHIIVEGHCMRKDVLKKDKFIHEIISFDPYKTKKIPNKNYDPNYRVPRKPSFCKGRICFTCLDNGCKWLGYTDADEEDYKHLDEFYKDDKKYPE